MERGSDSDGEDAMAYFLPNGIADDSPPKRSALTPTPSSFGPIGGRFGGIYGSGAPSSLDLSASLPPPRATPLYGSLGDPSSSSSSSAAPGYFLSNLGGEILQPRGNELSSSGPNANAIGGGRNPFAFSGAFAALAAEPEQLLEGGRSEFPEPNRRELAGTPKGSSGFRSDTDIFAPSSASGMYGRPTLNANAPAFMASSAQEHAPYSSSSPSSWPTMNVKPHRAPPGLSKPMDSTPTSSTSSSLASSSSAMGAEMGATTTTTTGAPLSLPPGLTQPSQSRPFGGYAPTTSSLFSGEGVRHFASRLQPSLTSLSDAFRSGGSATAHADRDFHSSLSELNAESPSVEEIQSNLKATAIAAAQDVVADTSSQKLTARHAATPRKAAKSPHRGVEFVSPPSLDEKRGGDKYVRAAAGPRSRTPTRRNEAPTLAAGTPTVAASPVAAAARSDRRSRNARDAAITERPARSTAPDGTIRTGRRARGGQSGSETKPGTRAVAAVEEIGRSVSQSTPRKKPPSSVSSVGSDDQLLALSTAMEAAEEIHPGPGAAKMKEPSRESKATCRNANTKKSAPAQATDKRGASRRQVYREKVAAPESQKDAVEKTKEAEVDAHGGSGADASGVDSHTEDALEGEAISAACTGSGEEKANDSVVKPTTPAKKPASPEQKPVEALAEVQSIPESPEREESIVPYSPPSRPAADVVADVAEDAESAAALTTDDEKASFSVPSRIATLSAVQTSPLNLESDSGSEIPEMIPRAVRSGPSSDRKTSGKKEKHKKERAEKKKATSSKPSKKEKRDSSSSGKGELAEDEPFPPPTKKKSPASSVKIGGLLRDGRMLVKRSVTAVWSAGWFLCTEFADRVNLKGFLGWSFSYLESFLAVVFSVILLLSLHGASFFIRLHRVAFRAVLTHRHVGFCFAFLYAFPFLVQYVFPWAPPWAPVCLWYAFLVQLFCTSGPTAMVATFRVVLPLVFLIEGISHHSFLLDLNGAELLLASFILSAMKTSNLCSPIFLLSLAVQCLSAVFLGSELLVQWFQLTLALYSLHAMAASDEDWAGLGDEEEDVSCRPISMHHSIADYNYHPAPSVPSIQKTKRLDRRALAYVRGRKFR